MPLKRTLNVGDEIFEVDALANAGSYQLTWVSGRNRGYGFSTHATNGETVDDETLRRAAVSFLDQIDPATGFIED